jgi:hypothetical protein
MSASPLAQHCAEVTHLCPIGLRSLCSFFPNRKRQHREETVGNEEEKSGSSTINTSTFQTNKDDISRSSSYPGGTGIFPGHVFSREVIASTRRRQQPRGEAAADRGTEAPKPHFFGYVFIPQTKIHPAYVLMYVAYTYTGAGTHRGHISIQEEPMYSFI